MSFQTRRDYVLRCRKDSIRAIRQEALARVGKDVVFSGRLSSQSASEEVGRRKLTCDPSVRQVIDLCDVLQAVDQKNNDNHNSSSSSYAPDSEDISTVSSLPGMRIYRHILSTMKRFPNQPSDHQKTFIRHALNMMLPVIFDGRSETGPAPHGATSDWEKYKKTICKLLDFREAIPQLGLLISTPRQFGKTEAMVMIATALVICVPGFRIISVSTSQVFLFSFFFFCLRLIWYLHTHVLAFK